VLASGEVELVTGAISALFALVIGLALALTRMSNRIARIEEWIRVREKRNNHKG
jgi:hypothetical protein